MRFFGLKKRDASPGVRVPVQSVEAQLRAELERVTRQRDELFALNQRQADTIDEYRGLRAAITVPKNAD